MKKHLLKFSKWTLSLLAMVALGACTETDADDNALSSVDGITISNVVPTYNDVTFNVEAKNSIAIAYIAVKKGTTLTVQDIFDQGVSDGNTSGTFTYKGKGLEAETDYTLYVAARSTSGNLGPAAYNFTTAVNTGAASSAQAAGIRVESISTNSLVWEVANGSDVDFSITMVQPTILMENECLEAAKNGTSEADYIASYLTNSNYAYLVRVTAGASTVASYNYNEIYSLYPMLPDSRYTIYTIGCKGDYESGIYETLAFTKLDAKTDAFTRIGNPTVDVELLYSDYIGLRHQITVNEDTKYWTKFFTNTSELEEFKAHYDEIEGEGQGRVRLKEFLSQVDPYVLEQSGDSQIYMNLDWGFAGIDFSRLALGFDQNLMQGDDYAESVDRLLEVDSLSEDGAYSFHVDSIAAGNFHIHARLQGNCYRVFYTIVAAGTYDDNYFEENPDMATAMAIQLDAEGYAAFRRNNDGTEQKGDEENANRDQVFDFSDFWYGYEAGAEYQVVSTSLNYDGKLSTPIISPAFKCLERTLGDFEPAITVTADADGASKTSVLVKYVVDADAYERDHRLFYHRFVNTKDSLFMTLTTDEEIRDWMLENNAIESNVWTTISNDSQDENPYEYYFNWAGMESGTSYKYLYFTERGDGQVSKLRTTEFTTLSNSGGDNPALTVTIDQESIEDTESLEHNYDTFYAKGEVKVNADVVSYTSLWVEEYALRSFQFDPDKEFDLHVGLYYCVSQQGLPSVDTSHPSAGALKKGERVWLVAQGQGANGVESLMSFVEINAEGQVLSQVDVDITDYVGAWDAPALKDPIVENFEPFNNIRNNYQRPALNPTVKIQSAPAASMKRSINDQEAAELREKGVPFYTLSDIARKAISKEYLK